MDVGGWLRRLGLEHMVEATRPPSGPPWVHEIKHDGYRLMVRRNGLRIRCFTRGGHDWADRFPTIVEAASRIKATPARPAADRAQAAARQADRQGQAALHQVQRASDG
jgi:hypothetical protein